MRSHLSTYCLCFLAFLCVGSSTALAQIKQADADPYLRLGEAQVATYRVGATVTASRGAVRDVFATVAVPASFPEQQVKLVEEDISDYVTFYDYRTLQKDNAKQLLMRVARLPNKAEAHAILTFEVRTHAVLPPEDTSQLVIPKRPPRDVKIYLGKSPLIQTKNSKIKKLLKKIFSDLENPEPSTEEASATDEKSASDEKQPPEPQELTDWQRVEAIYDYVQSTIQYKVQEDKSALATLKDGHGDCQNISALFIALCRTAGVPARIVWVHEHNYPEFCLADAEGELHWFPCESSGMRAFGEMPLARVIMAKGDNFRVPEQRKALRYASEYMTGLPAQSGGGPPSHSFIRQQL